MQPTHGKPMPHQTSHRTIQRHSRFPRHHLLVRDSSIRNLAKNQQILQGVFSPGDSRNLNWFAREKEPFQQFRFLSKYHQRDHTVKKEEAGLLPFHNIQAAKKRLLFPLFHEAVHENAKRFRFSKASSWSIQHQRKHQAQNDQAWEQRPQRQSLCPIGLKAHARIV